MTALTWKPILANLSEAYDELDELHARLYYLAFGEVPDKWKDDDSCKEYIEERDKRHPFTESALHASLRHAYHHLNWAWNVRRTQEERVWKCAEKDFSRWSKFPKGKWFGDLWTAKVAGNGSMADPAFRKVSLTPVRVSIQMALRKLGILCRLVAKEVGENTRWSVIPEGQNAEVGAKPLTEKEFAQRMHRIYAELNTAWNSRRDKTFVIDHRAILRRRCFPPFLL